MHSHGGAEMYQTVCIKNSLSSGKKEGYLPNRSPSNCFTHPQSVLRWQPASCSQDSGPQVYTSFSSLLSIIQFQRQAEGPTRHYFQISSQKRIKGQLCVQSSALQQVNWCSAPKGPGITDSKQSLHVTGKRVKKRASPCLDLISGPKILISSYSKVNDSTQRLAYIYPSNFSLGILK